LCTVESPLVPSTPFPISGEAVFFMVDNTGGLTDFHRELYLRNALIPEIGEEGQLRLLNSRVLVIGAGGLGSPVLLYLAASGVGEVGIADHDEVSLSNLQRQILYTLDDVGSSKCFTARKRLKRFHRHLRFNAHPLKITTENVRSIIEPYHFVIDATDNFEAKFLINDACVRGEKPFSHAGVMNLHGQTMTVVPHRSPCLRCIFGGVPPEGVVPRADQSGILGSVAGVIGSVQATEAVKCLLGVGELLTGRMFTWDALRMVFRVVALPKDRRCSVCSQENTTHQILEGQKDG